MDLFRRAHVPLVQSFVRRYPMLLVYAFYYAPLLWGLYSVEGFFSRLFYFYFFYFYFFIFRSVKQRLKCDPLSMPHLLRSIMVIANNIRARLFCCCCVRIVYGPTTSTFTRFRGIVSASFGGSRPYAYVASCSFGILWQVRQCSSTFREDLANRIRGECRFHARLSWVL